MKKLGFIPQKKLSFSYHLTDHCNLNCKGCDNYSCIAPEKTPNPEEFISDLKRLAELFKNDVENIYLLGGEPLLNKNAVDFCVEARKIFNSEDTRIHLVSNGILFKQCDYSFWNAVKENNIIVEYTPYPIKYPENMDMNIFDKYGVCIKRFGHNTESIKTLQFLPFDLNGCQDTEYNYKHCFHANKCIQLKNGVLYTCNIRAYIDIIVNRYGIDFNLSEADGINIYKAKSSMEILDFLSQPIPFCKYCNIKKRNDGHLWRTVHNNDSIYDWCLFEFDERGISFLNNYKNVCLITEKVDDYKHLPADSFKFRMNIYSFNDVLNNNASISDMDIYLLATNDIDLMNEVESFIINIGGKRICYVDC